MGAIRDHFKLREAVVKAVDGRDGRAAVHQYRRTTAPGSADEVRDILVSEANADPAFKARIEESYARIVALKQRIGD